MPRPGGWSGAGKRASWAPRGRLTRARGHVRRTASPVSTAHTRARPTVDPLASSELRPDFPAGAGPGPQGRAGPEASENPPGPGSPLQAQGRGEVTWVRPGGPEAKASAGGGRRRPGAGRAEASAAGGLSGRWGSGQSVAGVRAPAGGSVHVSASPLSGQWKPPSGEDEQ